MYGIVRGPGGVMQCSVTRGTRHSHHVGSLTDRQARKQGTDADGTSAAVQTADQHTAGHGAGQERWSRFVLVQGALLVSVLVSSRGTDKT